jgi:hypothetical protein
MIGLLIAVKTTGFGKEVKTKKPPASFQMFGGFFIVLTYDGLVGQIMPDPAIGL